MRDKKTKQASHRSAHYADEIHWQENEETAAEYELLPDDFERADEAGVAALEAARTPIARAASRAASPLGDADAWMAALEGRGRGRPHRASGTGPHRTMRGDRAQPEPSARCALLALVAF